MIEKVHQDVNLDALFVGWCRIFRKCFFENSAYTCANKYWA